MHHAHCISAYNQSFVSIHLYRSIRCCLRNLKRWSSDHPRIYVWTKCKLNIDRCCTYTSAFDQWPSCKSSFFHVSCIKVYFSTLLHDVVCYIQLIHYFTVKRTWIRELEYTRWYFSSLGALLTHFAAGHQYIKMRWSCANPIRRI